MMTKDKLILTVLLACLTRTCMLSAQDADVEQWKKTTWRINLNLDTPNLVPPAVQWTVLDKDAVPGFKARAKDMLNSQPRQTGQAGDTAKEEMNRRSQLMVAWEQGFRDVPGDKVYLLTSAPNLFSSNGPGGSKWIITKIVQIKGKLLCWCIPVEVQTGKEVHITLSEQNALDPASAFEQAIGEPSTDQAVETRTSNEGQSNGSKLAVVWTSGDPDVAHRVCFMYCHNAKKQKWFDQVVLVVWGPSARLLAADKDLQAKVKSMIEDGVQVQACVACADSYGVADRLRELKVEVKGMGVPLTEMLKTGWKVLTF